MTKRKIGEIILCRRTLGDLWELPVQLPIRSTANLPPGILTLFETSTSACIAVIFTYMLSGCDWMKGIKTNNLLFSTSFIRLFTYFNFKKTIYISLRGRLSKSRRIKKKRNRARYACALLVFPDTNFPFPLEHLCTTRAGHTHTVY